jgi:hypothetical protein
MDLGVLRTINILQLGRKGRLNESEIHLVSVSVSEIFSQRVCAGLPYS